MNRSARRLARWMDVEYLWVPLAVETRKTAPTEVGVDRSSGPEEGRAPKRTAAPEDKGSADGAIQRVVHQGAHGESLAHLRAELQVPSVLQELVGGLRKVSPFRVVVLANGDRVEGLDPWARGSTGPMLRALNELGVTLVLTWSGPPGSSAPEFTYTLRAPAFEPSGGLGGTMVCERGRGHGMCLVRTIFPDHLVICKARLEPARYHSLPQGTSAECPLDRPAAGR
ncbi:MAG: hypothetical protein KGJ23_13515 [Euryarchaeota archaeon]|nr:hypothetical protein [Euryarchaeota archaeon]MDE1837617.1 hypothetical protein [Euryarchaeota archaeon]MDE1880809.1 hypothetical protein [Euryarchaeota archaeon]MDE2045952.1 hypothetical protein [Thermoplasmata archaeon]